MALRWYMAEIMDSRPGFKVVFCIAVHLTCLICKGTARETFPVVINTWPFTNATDKAWARLSTGGSAVEAVVAGCSECERERCDGSVGYGSHPDEKGETTLDAMVMDGSTMAVGAVGGLRGVREAIGVAHAVLTYTQHTLLVGQLATDFAVSMGFKKSDLHTNDSISAWKSWKANNCQPNFRKNVSPDPSRSCGPYHPNTPTPHHHYNPHHGGKNNDLSRLHWRRKHAKVPKRPPVGNGNHDTIGMVVIDHQGNMASGTSTNGLNHKVPGRVGDSPIMGAGSYVDGDVGGAAATGDGDVMMRFLPSFHAVQLMRSGTSPTSACRRAVRQIATKYPAYTGAVIAASRQGDHGAGCYGMKTFTYSVRTSATGTTQKYTVKCV